MNRREFLIASAGTAAAIAAPSASTTTVLYNDSAVKLDKIRPDAKELWVRAADLPRINEFELKPQGACRADMCIPVAKTLKNGPWFNLTGFSRKLGQAYVNDSGVWSFGDIPVMRGSFYSSRIAPDFAVPDRTGKIVHLSDFRGKKVLVFTWASW
jgi:AhpC/TSA family